MTRVRHTPSMRVGKACRCHHRRSRFGDNASTLIEELSFSPVYNVIQIEHDEQHAMECFIGLGACLGIDFRVPMGIAAAATVVFLHGEGAELVQPPSKLRPKGLVD